MIRFAAVRSALVLCVAACSPQPAGETGPSAPATEELAPLKLPRIPPPGPLEAAAPRTLRIDVVGGKAHVIDGKVPNFVRIEGVAPADWFFEAVFPVRLEVDGQVMVETFALSLDDWTNGEPYHPYRATVAFDLAKETKAVLVLEEDMPKHDDAGNELPLRSVRIPVVLAPMEK